MKPGTTSAFDVVEQVGLTLSGVEAAQRYDGARILTLGGAFMAGLAVHDSAEPNSLVIRADVEARELWLQDAPEVYYLTDYYRRHPVVLVRLEQVTRLVLRDLLASSHRLTLPKGSPRPHRRR